MKILILNLQFLVIFISKALSKKYHILFFLADDLGYNDLGYVNKLVHTPTIDKLAKNGVRFATSYATAICGPSRNALMTGYYPYRDGGQHGTLEPLNPAGVPTNLPFLSETLTSNGYESHIVGKWDLGFCDWKYTPTHRGFKTFLGFYCPWIDHVAHESVWKEYEASGKWHNVSGYDFRDGQKLYRITGHSHWLYTKRIVDIIDDYHDGSIPLFLYVSFGVPHTPLQIPVKYSNIYSNNIASENRQKYLGMVTAMDESIKNITDKMKAKGLWDDTITIFSSDNGGDLLESASDNSPLKGGKWYLWEGGTRVRSFVHGKMLENPGVEIDGLFYITDWYSTLLSAVGIDYSSDYDSVNHWSEIKKGLTLTSRTTLVYNVDNYKDNCPSGALRVGNWKIIKGVFANNASIFDTNGASHNSGDNCVTGIYPFTSGYHQYALYNLANDPTESIDLWRIETDKLNEMKEILEKYYAAQVSQLVFPDSKESVPSAMNNFTWSPGWC